ncbi:MAG TPA: HlyD family efflux transporter periplasmic adaptor subunit, partial [Acidocella sp.]|nr:HlyD family efflux transporter periplasmic adaptor subunit [Acidocella sp.]
MIPRLRQLLPKAANQGALAAADEPLPLAVLEFQSPTAAVIATPMPPVARSTTHILTALVATLLVIGVTFELDQQVSGTAVLTSSAPDFSVQTFNSSSILRDVNVHPGQLVRKGQVVATLDPTYVTADLTGLTQQEQNYAAQVAQLQAQESGKPYVPDPNNPYGALQLQTYDQQMGQYNFSMENYQQQINQLQTQIDGYNGQAAYFRQRLGIASNVENMRKKLQQLQVGSELDTEAATDDRVSMQAEMENNVSEAQAAQKQLAAVTAQMNSFAQQFKAQASTQLATALNNLAQAQQDLTKAKLNSQEVYLTAPQDAVVESVAQASPGSVLQPGETLLTLSPVNAPFTVEAQIDATRSGYVHVGDKV